MAPTSCSPTCGFLLALLLTASHMGCISGFDEATVPLETNDGLIQLTGQTEVSRSDLLADTDALWGGFDEHCAAATDTTPSCYRDVVVANGCRNELEVEIDATLTFDGFVHVFETPWNPDSESGCLAGGRNEQVPGKVTLATVTMGPGDSLAVVVSNDEPEDTGTFTLNLIATRR